MSTQYQTHLRTKKSKVSKLIYIFLLLIFDKKSSPHTTANGNNVKNNEA